MEPLRVRVYNVRFGDAILLSVPDRDDNGQEVVRHILIDVGNTWGDEGGEDTIFGPVVQDILKVLDGQPLDLYVMTHEHLDHVQGLLYASKDYGGEDGLRARLQTQHAWLTASAAPDYYDLPEHANAKQQRKLAMDAHAAIAGYLGAAPGERTPQVDVMMLNNDYMRTKKCVDYLRSLAQHPWYVHRETDLTGKHPFRDASFEIWAPEEETSTYYGQFQPMTLGVVDDAAAGGAPTVTTPNPPPGVDAGAFWDLVKSRRSFQENLLAIDKAANNTSLVFCLNWHGWRLLFPGDAERRSWLQMNKAGCLAAVDFLKVSHHGSANGTPTPPLLKTVLPDGGTRYAALSTYRNTYQGVPDDDLMRTLGTRCELHSVLDADPTLYVEFAFAPDARDVAVTRA
jgi:beta-lactamase superfamily II metal-dependent hydrolase